MYLKHLREVERINNREADSVKSKLQEYRSISELHRHNKSITHKRKLAENQKSLYERNLKIFKKIENIGSDTNMKASRYHDESPNIETTSKKEYSCKGP